MQGATEKSLDTLQPGRFSDKAESRELELAAEKFTKLLI